MVAPQHVGATGNVRGATANLELTFHLDHSAGQSAANVRSATILRVNEYTAKLVNVTFPSDTVR
jgi:hypothetical protein